MVYLLDVNVFIQAKRLHYGLDFCPAFWEWLIDENEKGNVVSIEKISDEIEAGGDELWSWAEHRGDAFFLKPSAPLPAALRQVSTWATGQNYEQAAVSTFLQVADYYLVSQALADGYTVVTHEIPSTSKKADQDPRRVPRRECEVRDAVRDAAQVQSPLCVGDAMTVGE